MFCAGSGSLVDGSLYGNYGWERASSMVLRCRA